jgi:response regulator RpfG family c-di-GMP phosphodiesterase
LTSRRPYKEPIPCEQALDIMMRDRGRQFDPTLLDLFIGIAPAMYAEFGGHEDEVAHRLLMQRGRPYFFPER